MRPLSHAVAPSHRLVHAALVSLIAAVALPGAAHALPNVDDQRGLATDDLRDPLGIVTTSIATFNQSHSPAARTIGAANVALHRASADWGEARS